MFMNTCTHIKKIPEYYDTVKQYYYYEKKCILHCYNTYLYLILNIPMLE